MEVITHEDKTMIKATFLQRFYEDDNSYGEYQKYSMISNVVVIDIVNDDVKMVGKSLRILMGKGTDTWQCYNYAAKHNKTRGPYFFECVLASESNGLSFDVLRRSWSTHWLSCDGVEFVRLW